MVESRIPSRPWLSLALPESRYEVETIAADLPEPSTILFGSRATETTLKQLPLSQYNAIHLALHGRVNLLILLVAPSGIDSFNKVFMQAAMPLATNVSQATGDAHDDPGACMRYGDLLMTSACVGDCDARKTVSRCYFAAG